MGARKWGNAAGAKPASGATEAEMAALKAVLIEKGVLTEAEIDAKRTARKGKKV